MKRILIAAIILFAVCSNLADAQITLRYNQGPFTVTNGAVMRPFTCANNGTCAGTPTWSLDANVNVCMITVVGGMLNWSASGATPITGANPTTGAQWSPGVWFINSKPGAPNINLQRFRMIAATASNVNVTLECGW